MNQMLLQTTPSTTSLRSTQSINIVWFRRDLRLLDSQIVHLATTNQNPTIFVFCVDPWFYNQPQIGWKRVHFLFESLVDLDNRLNDLGSKLTILEGNTLSSLTHLATSLQKIGLVPELYFSEDTQVRYGLERDKQVRELFEKNNWKVMQGMSNFTTPNHKYGENWGKEYYTHQQNQLFPEPTQIINYEIMDHDRQGIVSTQPQQLLDRFNTTNQPKSELFTGGETRAHLVLESFLEHRSDGYHWKLSRPWLSQIGATSHLSPHIAFGTISTRVIYQRSRQKRLQINSKHAFSLKSFEERLRWRDHFNGKLVKDPSIGWQNHYPEFNSVYQFNELEGERVEYFERWKNGQTGFAMVDASMRQLNTQGYMNFRMRAMNATFLTINCGVSWHWGAQYFMTQLVDGDVAINHWQWQMQAGITNPFSQTFRIYNPDTNMTERDPDLQYIKYWCPEYTHCKTPKDVIEISKHMLDYAETRQKNGKIISDIRKQVRERLTIQLGIIPKTSTKTPRSRAKPKKSTPLKSD